MNQKNKIFFFITTIFVGSTALAIEPHALESAKLEAQRIQLAAAIQKVNSELNQLKAIKDETLLEHARLIVEQAKSAEINSYGEEENQKEATKQQEERIKAEARQKEIAINDQKYLDGLHVHNKLTSHQIILAQKSWESIKWMFGFGSKVLLKKSSAAVQQDKITFSRIDTEEKQEIFNNVIDSMQKDLQHDIEESRTVEASLAAKAAKADFPKNLSTFVKKINASGILRPDEVAYLSLGITPEPTKIIVYNMSKLDPFAKNLNSMIDRYNLEFGEAQEQRNKTKEIMVDYYLEGFTYNEQSGESLEQQIKKYVEEKVEQSVDTIHFDENKQINPDLLEMMVEKVGLKPESLMVAPTPQVSDIVNPSPLSVISDPIAEPVVTSIAQAPIQENQDIPLDNQPVENSVPEMDVAVEHGAIDLATPVSVTSTAEIETMLPDTMSTRRRRRRKHSNKSSVVAPVSISQENSPTLKIDTLVRRQRRRNHFNNAVLNAD